MNRLSAYSHLWLISPIFLVLSTELHPNEVLSQAKQGKDHQLMIKAILPPAPWDSIEGTMEIRIPSSINRSSQKAIWKKAILSSEPRPLLVGLHTWSGDYQQPSSYPYLQQAVERDWHFIHPDFRGSNNRPEATCSDQAVTDILDAVEFAKSHAEVAKDRVYLMGVSGGGMACLMMAAKAPDIWAGISCWAPISNLTDWHAETKARHLRYTAMIESSCGGPPEDNVAVNFQYWNRSPVHFLKNAARVNLDINAGIMDGHSGSVPVGHSLRAFNVLAGNDQPFSEAQIHHIEKLASLPASLSRMKGQDPGYGTKQPMLRRQSGRTRITLFEGTHEIIVQAAIHWLDKQRHPKSLANLPGK